MVCRQMFPLYLAECIIVRRKLFFTTFLLHLTTKVFCHPKPSYKKSTNDTTLQMPTKKHISEIKITSWSQCLYWQTYISTTGHIILWFIVQLMSPVMKFVRTLFCFSKKKTKQRYQMVSLVGRQWDCSSLSFNHTVALFPPKRFHGWFGASAWFRTSSLFFHRLSPWPGRFQTGSR